MLFAVYVHQVCLFSTCYRSIYELFVDLMAVFISQTERSKLSGDKVFHKDVGRPNELMHDAKAIGMLNIQSQRTFVTVG
jgi:hypothetical protein